MGLRGARWVREFLPGADPTSYAGFPTLLEDQLVRAAGLGYVDQLPPKAALTFQKLFEWSARAAFCELRRSSAWLF